MAQLERVHFLHQAGFGGCTKQTALTKTYAAGMTKHFSQNASPEPCGGSRNQPCLAGSCLQVLPSQL